MHTIVIGHKAAVSRSNRLAYTELGIMSTKEQDEPQDKLAESAAQWARKLVAHAKKARMTLSKEHTANAGDIVLYSAP